MATAPSRSRGPSRRPAPTASASRRSTRRSRCARAGIRAPIRVLYPIPPALVADAAAARASPSRPATWLGARRTLLATPCGIGAARPTRRSRSSWRSRPAWAAAASRPADVVDAGRRRSRPARRARLAGLWTHLQAPEDADRTGAQLERFDAVGARRCARPASAAPPRHVAASGGLLTGVAGLDGVRPGLAIYGLVPDELARRRRSDPSVVARASARSCRSTPSRSASRTCRPGDGVSYGPTFTHRAAEPDRDPAAGLWRRLRRARYSNRAAALVRGRRVPLVGNVAMDAVMADVTDVPGRAGHDRRRIRAPGGPGRRADHRRGPGATAHHEHLGGRDLDGSRDCPGCTMRPPRRSACGRSRSGEGSWPASNSGTATSATSRSMRSSTPRTCRSGCRRASAGRSSAPAVTRSSSRPCARRRSRSASRS